jgi:peptidoglycan-associated lipoprotein
MRAGVIMVVLAAVVLAAGCGRKSATKDDSAAARTEVPAATGETGATTAGAGGEDVAEARPLDGGAAGAAGAAGVATAETVIYFDFDRSELRAEYGAVIAAHAKRLAANPALKVRLEGNTDERGSREYNIALGERRAQSVRRALLLQGATEAQLTTVSYGEERPAVEGTDESAYAKNRRVEIAFGAP